MTYYLFIDDEREPHFRECVESGIDLSKDWIIARSTREARIIVKEKGCLPIAWALDHDLGLSPFGRKDTVMDFLKLVQLQFPNGPVPEYTVHTANPSGYVNIISFLESWKKSITL